jgi:DNA-binding NarL/FixJ family response regulator
MNDTASNSLDQVPESRKIRILLVDDHAIVRQGLRMFIELQNDMTVAGEGADGREAVALAAQLQPDIVLLDLAMPVMDGVEAALKIRECSPGSLVLILTSFGEDDKVFPAIRAGAHGYLLKDIQPQDLLQALRAAYRGEAQLHPQIIRRLMSAVVESTQPEKPRSAPEQAGLETLTQREREVLGMIAQGLNNREIADQLVIGESTVKTHVSNLLDKLGLEDRTRAAIWAFKHGLGRTEG